MNTTKGDWQRVTRRRPCPICGRPDWCTFVGPDDSPTVVCCMRVESDRPTKNGGWLHRLRPDDNGRPNRRRVRTVATKPDERPVLDSGGFARQCQLGTSPQALAQLADSLGVTRQSLERLGVGWSPRYRAWTFPMSNAAGEVVGIRLRKPDGGKLSVRGGKEGLFIPTGLQPGGRLLVCEGPSDTAACLDWGFQVVGRPSCTGGVRLLVELVKRMQPEEVVIVADDDGPGQRGAENLARVLLAYVPVVRVIAPPAPHKDARAWLRAGATAADVQAAIDAAPVRWLRVTTTKKGRCTDARAKQS